VTSPLRCCRSSPPDVRVVVTRPRAQAEPLADALRARGFEPVSCPLIETEPIDDGPIDVSGYDWVGVTSANGAAELARRGTGPMPRIAAVGDATAAALADHGLQASFVPSVASQEALLAEFPRPPGRALFVGGADARRLLADQLPADFRAVYRTVELSPDPPDGDLVLLASPSAARAWAKLGVELPAITIGPQTTAAATAAGLEVVAEAEHPDVAGLVDSAAAWRVSSRS
jgi:uroporphyrinogen-III synthase